MSITETFENESKTHDVVLPTRSKLSALYTFNFYKKNYILSQNKDLLVYLQQVKQINKLLNYLFNMLLKK